MFTSTCIAATHSLDETLSSHEMMIIGAERAYFMRLAVVIIDRVKEGGNVLTMHTVGKS